VAAVGVGVLLLLLVGVREDDDDGEGDDGVREREKDETGDGVVIVEVWLPFAFGGALEESAVHGGCEGEGDDRGDETDHATAKTTLATRSRTGRVEGPGARALGALAR
jgi:hypothetical protein